MLLDPRKILEKFISDFQTLFYLLQVLKRLCFLFCWAPGWNQNSLSFSFWKTEPLKPFSVTNNSVRSRTASAAYVGADILTHVARSGRSNWKGLYWGPLRPCWDRCSALAVRVLVNKFCRKIDAQVLVRQNYRYCHAGFSASTASEAVRLYGKVFLEKLALKFENTAR